MRWVTYLIIFIMVLVFISPFNDYDTEYEPVNYLLRTAYHANATHLIVNMISFYYLSFIEEEIGWELFLFAIIFIWIVSSMLLYAYQTILPSQKVHTVGFSAVIFGLIVVYYFMMNFENSQIFWNFLIILGAQFFTPNISVSGHITGIIAGLIFVQLVPSIKNFHQSIAGRTFQAPL